MYDEKNKSRGLLMKIQTLLIFGETARMGGLVWWLKYWVLLIFIVLFAGSEDVGLT